MEKLKVGILGATGMVGQRFATLLANHPWFEITTLAASPRSAGQTYEQAVEGRWKLDVPMPDAVKKMVVKDVSQVEDVAKDVDFVFSAVDMKKDEIRAIEEAYAKAEVPVVSNNSAHRWTPDVPMVIPEINPEHYQIILQNRRNVLARHEDLLLLSRTVRFSHIHRHLVHGRNLSRMRSLFLPIRRFPEPERTLNPGRRW